MKRQRNNKFIVMYHFFYIKLITRLAIIHHHKFCYDVLLLLITRIILLTTQSDLQLLSKQLKLISWNKKWSRFCHGGFTKPISYCTNSICIMYSITEIYCRYIHRCYQTYNYSQVTFFVHQLILYVMYK